DAGEDLIVSCPKCDYAANLEKAISRLAPITELESVGDGKPELVSTPGVAAVADVAKFFNISEAQDIKCVAYMAETKRPQKESLWTPVVVFLRGDHQVNETKLIGLIKASELRPMNAEELERYIQGPAGFLGPIGLVPAKALGEEGVTVIVDRALEGRQNM